MEFGVILPKLDFMSKHVVFNFDSEHIESLMECGPPPTKHVVLNF
jgi:hypothetical protein